MYLGNKRLLGIGMTIAGGLLTYVEMSIKDQNMRLYLIMFLGIFILNTCMAIDGYLSTKTQNDDL